MSSDRSDAPRFFRSDKDLRKWLEANHSKSKGIWVGLRKDGSTMKQSEALDQAICFGWIMSIIKRIDEFTYKIRLVPRKPKSQWSSSILKKAEALKKRGLMHESGSASLKNRERHKLESGVAKFSPKQLKEFKANAKAWDWFNTQTKSYRYYTTAWVVSAKRPETREKRLAMLIGDSGRGQKLQRILDAIEKVKPKYPEGRTPIEAGRGVGPLTGSELRSIGIETVENLRQLGWEKAFYRLCETYPNRINLNMLHGLIGAELDCDWRKIDPEIKAEAKAVMREIKETFGSDR
jgi:uncharacterized protein YdeI (YjbR/CyaY-like superfamily)